MVNKKPRFMLEIKNIYLSSRWLLVKNKQTKLTEIKMKKYKKSSCIFMLRVFYFSMCLLVVNWFSKVLNQLMGRRAGLKKLPLKNNCIFFKPLYTLLRTRTLSWLWMWNSIIHWMLKKFWMWTLISSCWINTYLAYIET